MKYSKEQLSHIIAVIMILLQAFDINITSDELSTIIYSIVGVIAIFVSFWKRYKRGDLKFSGVRKTIGAEIR
jgi:hypothetical protein